MILLKKFRDKVYDKMNKEKNKLKVDNIQKKSDHIFLFILTNILLLISLLYLAKIFIIPIYFNNYCFCIILYFKNTHYVYEYLYSNMIYFYTLIILIYLLKNKNFILFIQIILCIIIYKLCQK